MLDKDFIPYSSLNKSDKTGTKASKKEVDHSRKRGRNAKSYYDQPIQKIQQESDHLNFEEMDDQGIAAQVKDAPAADKGPQIKEVEDALSVDSMDIPWSYNETALTLVARDPYCIYAYWEMNSDTIDKLRERIGVKLESSTYTMRVYDVTFVDFNGQNANYWFDLDELYTNEKYVNVWSDNATFCAEIGVRTPEGEFYPAARSNIVTTPRANFSNRYDMIWKEVNDEEDDAPVYVNVKLLNRKRRGKLKPRSNWQINTSRIGLNKDDILSYYRNNQAMIKQVHIVKSLKESGLHNISDEERIQVEKSIIPALMKGQCFHHSTVGSSDLNVKEKQDDFYFEIQMELTVKGKVQPGGEVLLGNQKVEVNEDGTFTLKFPLEDGSLPFNFLAFAKEKGLGKKINTSVLRTKTERNP